MNPDYTLTDKTILITRPDGREGNLRRLIEEAGGKVIHYPVINIQPPPELDIQQLVLLREQLHGFTMAIFISPTAVEQSRIYFPALPEHFTIVSIGNKTTEALEKQNIHVDVEAPDKNTESLLQHPLFQMPKIDGRRILIFRGSGGRALLGDSLIRRGAQVRYVETYQRELPPHPPLDERKVGELDAITISSNEGLDNLITLMEDPSLLIDIPLIVPSPRAHTLARQHGFKTIITAENATDEAAITALSDYFSR
ncbi:MAG: uroporphyrinogen-III synthase [Gammaproteobacteria bacterium]|jgi:uroporphyrinogen-III synthase|nr:uroporphyrinogen-III synthase [Gammaproteobacteria bacterium]